MKKQYSKKRRQRGRTQRRQKTRTQKRQRQRQRQRQNRGGNMSPSFIPTGEPTIQPSSEPTQPEIQWLGHQRNENRMLQNSSTIMSSIKNAINAGNGRWSTVFHIINENTGKMMVSASNNSINQEVMNSFVQNLQQKMQEINNDLAPISINNLQVLDITKDEVMSMSQDPNVVPFYDGIIEEELEDWDTGIQKLVLFSL
jgi:hypothetical protein